MSTGTAPVSQLRALEAEAVHAVREVVAELERPVLLFSGGKDSIALLRVAEKAFRVGDSVALPFPVLHVDTGHNFPEVVDFRDRRVAEGGHRLIVASVQESIDAGRVKDDGPGTSRNRLQTTTLLDALEEGGFDAAFGGARRDEERARARSACSPSATSSASGSRAPSARSRGRSTTAASAAASTSASSR
jgi:sulfate adenylyltransferase subunit 2